MGTKRWRNRLPAGLCAAAILLFGVAIQPAVARQGLNDLPGPGQLPPVQVPELPDLPEVPGQPATPNVPEVRPPSTNETVDEVRDTVNESLDGEGAGGGVGTGDAADPSPSAEPPAVPGDPEIGNGPAAAQSPRAGGSGDRREPPAAEDEAGGTGPDPVRGGDRQFLTGELQPRVEPVPPAPEPRQDATLAARIGDTIAALPSGVVVGLLGMAALALLMTGRSAWFARTTDRLRVQRSALRDDVGVLQSALVPDIPAEIAGAALAVAYRPASGPAAGGDFHDVFELGEDRFGIVFGDVSGHGPDALPSTAIIRYTIRAYLEAGLEPHAALRLADRALAGSIGGDFATAIAAVFHARTGLLTYAGAGHPAPLFCGGHEHRPVAAMSAPPIGRGPAAGSRQTTASIGLNGTIWLFTDGLIEVRGSDGELLKREGLESLLADDPDPAELLDRIAGVAAAVPDDMTVCSIRPADVADEVIEIEEVELGAETDPKVLREFAAACGLSRTEVDRVADIDRAALPATLRISTQGSSMGWELLPDRPDPGGLPEIASSEALGEAVRIPG